METIVKNTANKKGLDVAIKDARTIANKGATKATLRNGIKMIVNKSRNIVLF